MIRLREDVPDHVVIATASGTVTGEDYEQTLLPAVERASKGGAKARLLYVLGSEFMRFDPSGAADDLKMGMDHWTDFERIGLVTDHEGYSFMARAFGFVMPGEVRVFPTTEMADAEAWILGD